MVAHLIRGGHTTKSIGAAIGLSQPSVSRLATGRTGRLNADAALRLIELAGGKVDLPALQAAAADHAPEVAP
jgi:predicted XRE-type DNA-binding protein